jgi:integrase/recombinase XerD
MRETIHDYESIMRSVLNKVNNRNSISLQDKETIYKFKEDCLARGLSKARTIKYIYHLMKISDWLDKDFENATRDDIKSLVLIIEKSSYSLYTKEELKTCIRRLYKLIRNSDDYPSEVNWIMPRRIKAERKKLPEELLSEEDIKKLINAANCPRDKAFISILYESGCRIGEILFIKVKHVQFDQHGATILVSGKTGSRRLRLITSVPYLSEWLNYHKNKENPDAYLWLSKENRTIRYQSLQKMMNKIGRKAGIRKKLNFHNFRHSRATYLANHLTDAQMREYFGWVRTSDMTAVYVHLSGRDIDGAILKVHGITRNKDTEASELMPKVCSRCDFHNKATNRFCSRCGMPLEREMMMKITETDLDLKEADRILDEMIKDGEFRKIFLRKARELVKQS